MTFKWILILALLYINFCILPAAVLCVYWHPFVPLVIIPGPGVYIIREYRRQIKRDKTNTLKYKHHPDALEDYLKLLDKD